MQIFNITNLPVFLPLDKAPAPFGDPFDDCSGTNASPAVFTAAGYKPTNGDAVVLSVAFGGSLDANFTVGFKYYVVGASGSSFSLSATSGGTAINAAAAASTGIVLHLVSREVDGVTIPFKPGYTVVVLNLSAGPLTLQGASDMGVKYGDVQGPGSFSTIVTVPAGSAALATLSYDWIQVSTSGTLVLMQN